MFRSSCIRSAFVALLAISSAAETEKADSEWALPPGLPNAESEEVQRIRELIRTEEYEAAIELAAAQVEEILGRTHQYDHELVAPLTLLGDGFHAMQEFSLALESYLQARQLTRIANGLNSLDQVNLLYREASTLYAMNRVDDANTLHERAFTVFREHFGHHSPELIPGMQRLAYWYLSTGNIFAARSVYRGCVELAEERVGTGSRPVIDCLKGLARTYRMERWSRSVRRVVDHRPPTRNKRERRERFKTTINDYKPGERALLDVVRMLLDQKAPDLDELAAAKLELADWYLLFEDWKRAFVIYRNVLKTHASADSNSFVKQELSAPKLLHVPYPKEPAPERLEDYARQTMARVEFEVSVNRAGMVSNIALVAVEPASLDERRYQTSSRYARFRPAFEEGVPVAVDAVPLIYEFLYLKPRNE